MTVDGAGSRRAARCGALLLAAVAGCSGEGALPDAGSIACVAGCDPAGSDGDGGPAAAAKLGRWLTIAVDAAGNVFIADLFAHRVRRVDDATGTISTIAGSGERGFAGDGGPAPAARLGRLQGIAVDRQGNVFLADSENLRVRRVDAATARIETVAGNGEVGFPVLPNGDGGPPHRAAIQKPTALAVDGGGGLFIGGWFSARIRCVEPERRRIRTVAGTGVPGPGGEDESAARTPIGRLVQLASDTAGNLFVAETDAHRVRRIDAASGRMATVAGTGRPGFAGDGGDATGALLAEPSGIAVDALVDGEGVGADRFPATDPALAEVLAAAGYATAAFSANTLVGGDYLRGFQAFMPELMLPIPGVADPVLARAAQLRLDALDWVLGLPEAHRHGASFLYL